MLIICFREMSKKKSKHSLSERNNGSSHLFKESYTKLSFKLLNDTCIPNKKRTLGQKTIKMPVLGSITYSIN